MIDPSWLDVARELQSIAQAGLTFTKDSFDRERYERLTEIAVKMFSDGSSTSPKIIADLFAREKGYPTPKVDVRGALFQADKVLLVKELSDGLWTLPGGWADVNNSPSEAIEREIREESGFLTRAIKLSGVLDRRRHGHYPPQPLHVYKLFFLVDLIGGEPQTSIETSAVEFFNVGDLPDLSIARVTKAQISRLYQHYLDPSIPTDFD